jgi:hypothetical protein
MIYGEARGSHFSSVTQKMTKPVILPKAENLQWTGTKNSHRYDNMAF